ncbi:hypothetical protein SALBM135S_01618 [Streptomyces alboniger]
MRTGPGEPDRLVVVVHHLAMDGVSWRVLLPDLHTACTGGTLDPAGASWRRHARLLAEQGTSGARRGELDHWRTAMASATRIGDRRLDPARDTVATAHRSVTVASAEVTEAVLTTLPAAYRAGVDEVLLAALVLALREHGVSGDAMTVTMEGHGREHLDLARTVGWFTSEYPVRVPATGDVGRVLRAAKEAGRAVPDGGIGYGVLRCLDPSVDDEFRNVPAPDVLLNYLGRFAPLAAAGWRLPERDAFAVTEPDAKALEQVLALNCFVHEEGAPRLAVEWTAATGVLGTDAVEALQTAWAAALDALAEHARHTEGGLTPSDLPLVDLDQAAIDALERTEGVGRVADVLPATPLQVGLSFHTQVRDDPGTDVYVVQAVTTLVGDLVPERMAEAARELLRRHPALRVYLGTAGDDVVQVIPADVALDFTRDDRFEDAVRAELARPFDPARPPLIRFLLSRVGPAEHKLVITNHHALLDGWSMPLVGRTLLALYAELSGGPAAPVAPPLAEYFRWLAGRDREASLNAWRQSLAGVEDATRLAPASTGTGVERPGRVSVGLGQEFSDRLRSFAREQGVTLTTVLQTAWGLLLGRLTGRRDVVFGCPVSGRPAEVDGVESMIGQLGTTIPVPIDRLPLTPGGKLDPTALPAPETATAARREPATEAEAILLGVFRDVLGTDDIGPDDAFFSIGGDSIVSLQVVSRARRQGLGLTARDVFEGETVAGIAARARALDGGSAPATGDAPLTPVMRDLLRRAGTAADGFCQWVEVCVPAGGDEASWRAVLDAVLARHDVLRAHLSGDVLRVPPVGAVTGADVLTSVRAAADDPRSLVDAEVASVQREMDPRTGPLLRAVWVDAGPDRPGRLVLIAHHLVVDGVSWRVLLDDVEHAHSGGTLARHGQSFVGWARSLREADRRAELPHWRRMTATPALTEPLDPARDTAATAAHHEIWLDAEATRALITTLPAAHRTTPDAVLLTALARAVRDWRGTPELLVALESHGRPSQVDLSQTVGWFTAVHPVRLDVRDDIQAVRERLRAQGDGLGHGILTSAGLLDPVRPEVAWNYLGQFPGAPERETAWQAPPDADPLGSGGTGELPLPHSLMVNALVRDDALGIRITWPSALFSTADVEALAEHLRAAALAVAAAPEITGLAGDRPVAEVQPLTPLQEVMLRHSRTERPDPYTVQSAFTLAGHLDVDALHAAGADLLARHPNLGAVFPGGLAVIPESPRPDCRVCEGPADEVLAADLAEPFDLAGGPLVRLTVVRRAPDLADLVLTTHHVLSDGWSAPRILTELFALYTARVRGEEPALPAPVPFADYLRWRSEHEPDLDAWAAELEGLPEGDYLSSGDAGAAWQEPTLITFDAELVSGLSDLAARHGLTRNTLVQGAWALLLGRRSGRGDVCFGAMVACRPPEVAGVEEIIGLLANTVPVRARLRGTLAETLADLQAGQQVLVEHHHVALTDLERLTGRRRLFDSLVVFENYPVDPDRLREPAPGLTVVGTRFRESTHHPVTLTVMPDGDGWTGVLGHRAGVDVDGLADELLDLLRTLDSHLDTDVSDLLERP